MNPVQGTLNLVLTITPLLSYVLVFLNMLAYMVCRLGMYNIIFTLNIILITPNSDTEDKG